jgi:hypothetical protein
MITPATSSLLLAAGLVFVGIPTDRGRAMASENIATMIQAVIDHPDLDRYYHADARPERKPLVISLTGAPAGDVGRLTKFGMPVKVMDTKGTGPVLSLTVHTEGGQTRIDFSYPPEGVGGRAVFTEKAGKPVLKDLSISER